MRFLSWLFEGPYNPLDLDSHPRRGWIPCHDFAGTPLGRNLMAFALRGAPIENPDLDPRRSRETVHQEAQ